MKGLYYAATAALAAVERRRPLGRPIWADEWDLCIVLDSARADMVRQSCPEGLSVRSHDTAWSVGSVTTEWLTNTFSDRHADAIADTALVAATPHTQTVFRDREWLTSPEDAPVGYPASPAVRPRDFDAFYEVWRTHADAHGAVPPETMARATVDACQRHDRVVAHWLQPHEPWLAPDAQLVGGLATEANVWDGLQAGTVNEDAAWQSYQATLDMAWQWVERVCDSVAGDVLITADHGNAFGEWGIFGHPFGWPQPAVRRVPWLRVRGQADATLEPRGMLDAEQSSPDRDAQLAALGYR